MSEPETTRHALAPEPLIRFMSDPIRRDTLKAILREPVFIAAMNLLQETSRVRPEHLSNLPDISILRKTAFHAGIASVYESLQELTKNNELPPDIEGWDHLKPTEP